MIAIQTNFYLPAPQTTVLVTRMQIKKAQCFLSISDQVANKGEIADVETAYDVSIPPSISHLLPVNPQNLS